MPLFIVVILLILILFLLAMSFRLLNLNRARLAILAMIVVIVGITAFISYHLFFYYGDDTVAVAMSTDEVHEDFTLKIQNKIKRYEFTWTSLVTPLDQTQLRECIERQHENARIAPFQDEMRITLNNSVITIRETEISHFLFRTRYHYEMQTECINLDKKTSDGHVCIPFPKDCLDLEGGYEERMDILCDMKELQEFYQYFTNVSIRDDEIVIHQDALIKIRIEGGKVFITLL